MRFLISIILTILVTGCSYNNGSRYKMSQDQAPARLPTRVEISDINPRYEPYSRGGNKDYTVRGISYQVLKDATNYVKEGNASWYGSKFHGHLTSNGEIYNMYTLSAAHKTLPLPSFVKVTNLANNKQIIVRVNDRGPFHSKRIIDLSYGAAHRLEMLKSGTARVKIEVLTFPPQIPTAIAASQPIIKATPKLKPELVIKSAPEKDPSLQCMVQLAASSNKSGAQRQLSLIASQHLVSSHLEQAGNLFRMQLGPLATKQDCDEVLKKIALNYPKAFIKML